MEQKISQEELNERIAILKRFRELLERQRKKFQEYLDVLESQETKIEDEDAESILAHSELEAQIVQSIGSLQKVIEPMQLLYNERNLGSYKNSESVPVLKIQKDLADLQNQVLVQNEKNRSLLKSHMMQLKKQITEFKNPYRSLNSVYVQKAASTGTRIQIEV
jgi:chromosome condensin MukBEF ATPase and DNA-binding subunit MukB